MAGSPKMHSRWRARPPRLRHINFVLVILLSLYWFYTRNLAPSTPAGGAPRPLVKNDGSSEPGLALDDRGHIENARDAALTLTTAEAPKVLLDCPRLPEDQQLHIEVRCAMHAHVYSDAP